MRKKGTNNERKKAHELVNVNGKIAEIIIKENVAS